MDQLKSALTGQVTSTAAEIYESFFVPALFGQWPDRVLDAARLSPNVAVLDVGCGTGILARAAARRLDGSGAVVGIDVNDGMLAVARRSDEQVTWKLGQAEDLPFSDNSFDLVASQFALMFYTEPRAALREMARVARPGGTIAIATWAQVEESPGYAAMADLLDRLFGQVAVTAFMAPFTLGTEADLRALSCEILPDAVVTSHQGQATFESIEAWVHTEIRGWSLANMLDDSQYSELLAAATMELTNLTDDGGRVRFDSPALITTATAS